MWRLLDQLADLERRASALYGRFGRLYERSPLVASFWQEMASEEQLHALIVAAAREVFPSSAPAPDGEWQQKLASVDQLLSTAESKAAVGLALEDAFAIAEQVEASELNAMTELIIHHAGSRFSRLGPLVGQAGVDRHRDKVLEARRRFCETGG